MVVGRLNYVLVKSTTIVNVVEFMYVLHIMYIGVSHNHKFRSRKIPMRY